MLFNVDKDELVRLLEVIIETQSDEVDTWKEDSVKEHASDMLLNILRLPLKVSKVMITEEESLFLCSYY